MKRTSKPNFLFLFSIFYLFWLFLRASVVNAFDLQAEGRTNTKLNQQPKSNQLCAALQSLIQVRPALADVLQASPWVK